MSLPVSRPGRLSNRCLLLSCSRLLTWQSLNKFIGLLDAHTHIYNYSEHMVDYTKITVNVQLYTKQCNYHLDLPSDIQPALTHIHNMYLTIIV